MAPTRSVVKDAKKRVGRPPKSKSSNGTIDAAPDTAPPKRRGRPSKSSQVGQRTEKSRVKKTSQKKAERTAPPIEPTVSRKRKAKDVELDELAEDGPDTEKQLRLVPSKRRIPRDAIDQWPDMTTTVMEGIKFVLQRAKDETVRSRRDDRRRNEAYDVLSKVVRRLERQLSHAKMPPNAKDIHFNLDRLTERNGEFHRQLTTARHANQLLAEQLQRATDALEQAQLGLQKMNASVFTWKQKREAQERKGKLHPLLDLPHDSTLNADGPDDIGLRSRAPVDTAMLDAPDDDLDPLLEQLRRSLQSLQGSHDQVEGISEAMHDAQTALDNLLFKHTSAQQYDAL